MVLILALIAMMMVGNRQTTQAVTTGVAPSIETIIGLTTSNQLITFYTNAPNRILATTPITGLLNGEIVLGIDLRPTNNQIYGFTNYNRLITLNPATGAATLVAPLSIGLSGNEYDIDFNPICDCLRIVNDTDQNVSVDPTTGVVTLRTPLHPGNPNITGIAHSNNVAAPVVPASTELFAIDSDTDKLYMEDPIHSYNLAPRGPLGVDTNALVGFDISGASSAAYASLTDPSSNASSLYYIDIQGFPPTFLGQIGNSPTAVRDITVIPLLPETIFGLTTSNQLITFNAARPELILSSTQINGLLNGEIVLGIDFRPATNQLYGFTNYNRIVTINQASATATVVGTPNPLSGNEYGFDFNPMADRIRIVNDTDQNVRINPDTGLTAAADPNLAYASGDPNFGQNPNVVGLAYTNSVAAAPATVLYDIDSNLDILALQNPPNNGTLNTIGSLGVNTNSLVGFDISGATGIAYASLSTPYNVSSLYAINLSTGAATLIKQIGDSPTSVRDIAISTLSPPKIFAVDVGNHLLVFSSLSPFTFDFTNFGSKRITGLLNGEAVIGIDFRPATGQLYGYTNYNRLVTINTTTAAATVIGSPASLIGNDYGFDVNPVADRIRIVNNTDQNIRVNPNDGTLTATDPLLAYAPGDPNFGADPNIAGAAYTNNFVGASSTTLYDIDYVKDILVTQGSPNGTPTSPNSGQLFTVGPLGVDTTSLIGFDIDLGSNAAYAALRPTGQPTYNSFSFLYSINLSTGRATLIGFLNTGPAIIDIAIAPPGTIAVSNTTPTSVAENAGTVTVTVTRAGDTNNGAAINYTTQNMTAGAGFDYTATSGTLLFNPGETTKTFTVPILDDGMAESSETFQILLSSASNEFTPGAMNPYTITITDND